MEGDRRHAPGIEQVEGFIRDADVAGGPLLDVDTQEMLAPKFGEQFVDQPRAAAMKLAHASAEYEVQIGRGCAPEVVTGVALVRRARRAACY
jgi:hypothetical protein